MFYAFPPGVQMKDTRGAGDQAMLYPVEMLWLLLSVVVWWLCLPARLLVSDVLRPYLSLSVCRQVSGITSLQHFSEFLSSLLSSCFLGFSGRLEVLGVIPVGRLCGSSQSSSAVLISFHPFVSWWFCVLWSVCQMFIYVKQPVYTHKAGVDAVFYFLVIQIMTGKQLLNTIHMKNKESILVLVFAREHCLFFLFFRGYIWWEKCVYSALC